MLRKNQNKQYNCRDHRSDRRSKNKIDRIIIGFAGITNRAYMIEIVYDEAFAIMRFQKAIEKIKLEKNTNKLYFKNLPFRFDCYNISGHIDILNCDTGTIYSGLIRRYDSDCKILLYTLSNRPIAPVYTCFNGIIQIEITLIKKLI